jgi:outer membrane receptor protein involved in Fe transport
MAVAHTGYLSGQLTDRQSGQPVIGANIYVREISSGTASDIFGLFKLTLKPGTYTIEVSFIGYQTYIKNVEIVEHQTVLLDVSLESGSVQLSDLVITSHPVSGKTTHLSSIDIAMHPVNSSQEVLRMVPGLFIAQHAGGGKAEQIFLRGFDIDHGTDINITVDGMPVNMVSHAHGQGYSDLHFLIPETIAGIDFDKGPYHSDHGNFATAGYVSFKTANTIDKSMVKLEGGNFGLFRNVNLIKLLDRQKDQTREQLHIASEFFRSDGYFDSPQNFRRINLSGKYFRRVNDRSILSVAMSGFSSRWNASGQIPMRAVRDGTIGRFGSIDDTEGGETSRYNINLSLASKINGGYLEHRLYGTKYNFDLLSNFTFYLNDPVRGDRILQRENRNIAGYNLRYSKDYKLHKLDIEANYGAGLRFDHVNDIHLTHVADRDRVLDHIASGDINEVNVHSFTDYAVRFTSGVSVKAGVRYDQFFFKYKNDLAIGQAERIRQGVLSPKISLEYDATTLTRLFIKAGYGFHSNDARIIVSDKTGYILPRAFGVDVGTQWKPFPDVFLQAATWMLDLQQELVYVGDEGIVETSGATRRKGVEVSIRYQINKNWYVDSDVNYTFARSKTSDTNEGYIPLAPGMTTVGGIQYKKGKVAGNLRYRYLADRPANEDNSLVAEGYLLVDTNFSLSLKNITVTLSAENLINTEWNEAQFETTSRLNEEPHPVTEIHFTPGSPRQLKLSLQWMF